MGKYDEKDAAKDTGSSVKEVSQNWHQARDDAAGDPDWGVPSDRHSGDGGFSILDIIGSAIGSLFGGGKKK